MIPVGVVLAGGKSTRLGKDKAALEFDGRSLLARTHALLTQLTREVVVVGRDPAALGLSQARWLADTIPGLGPMGGVATALAQLQRPCLVLSCDLPFMDHPTLARLLLAWEQRPATALMTTFRQVETGWVESLVAVYEPAAAELLEHILATGGRKLSAAIPAQRRHTVDYTQAQAAPFFNLNRPDDLDVARRLAASAGACLG